MKKRIAIVVSDLAQFGGVPAVAKYFYEIIAASDNYTPSLISVATSANDRNSLRLAKPTSWLQGATVSEGKFFDYKFRHFGANFAEFEPFRYFPRKKLDEVLREFDLIQIVAGTPAWTYLTKNIDKPIVLQVATLVDVERVSVLRETPQPRKTWLKAMTLLNRLIEKRALKLADLIFVENTWFYKYLVENGFEKRTVFAPPGIDTDFFVPESYKIEGYMLCVGRFDDPRKNIRLLLDTYKNLLEKVDNLPNLVLAGKSGLPEKDCEYAKIIGIFDKIKILKDLSLEKLREVYQNASLFILSSDEEGLGLVILEAMACGLPVISTKCGGAEEIVVENETGFLVEKGSSNELTEKIELLLADAPLRKQMGIKSRQRVLESFSMKETAKIFLSHYDKFFESK